MGSARWLRVGRARVVCPGPQDAAVDPGKGDAQAEWAESLEMDRSAEWAESLEMDRSAEWAESLEMDRSAEWAESLETASGAVVQCVWGGRG